MAKRKRRAVTKEFKGEDARLVRDSGKSVGAIARELDLTETALRGWVRQGGGGGRPGAAGGRHTGGAGGAGGAAKGRAGVGAPPAARGADITDGARHPKKSDGLLREGEPVRFAFI